MQVEYEIEDHVVEKRLAIQKTKIAEEAVSKFFTGELDKHYVIQYKVTMRDRQASGN